MKQEPVYTFAKWQVQEGELDNVLKLLEKVARQSRKEEGNLFYKVHQSKTEANVLLLYEGYNNAAAAETHRNSDHFQQFVIGKIVPKLATREVIMASEICY